MVTVMGSESLWVAAGLIALLGAIGALVRHGLNVIYATTPATYRRSIVAVNVVGGGLAGFALTVESVLGTVVAVGLLGSMTTFSTVAVWIAEDIRQRKPRSALWLSLSHLVWGVPAIVAGWLLGNFAG